MLLSSRKYGAPSRVQKKRAPAPSSRLRTVTKEHTSKLFHDANKSHLLISSPTSRPSSTPSTARKERCFIIMDNPNGKKKVVARMAGNGNALGIVQKYEPAGMGKKGKKGGKSVVGREKGKEKEKIMEKEGEKETEVKGKVKEKEEKKEKEKKISGRASKILDETSFFMSKLESAMKGANADPLLAIENAISAHNLDPNVFLEMLGQPEAEGIRTMIEDAIRLQYKEREGGDTKVVGKEESGKKASTTEEAKSQISVLESAMKLAEGNPEPALRDALKAINMDRATYDKLIETPEAKSLKLMIDDAALRNMEREGVKKAGAMVSSTRESTKDYSLPEPSKGEDEKVVGKEGSGEEATIRKQPTTNPKRRPKRGSKTKSQRHISEVTFKNVPMGAKPGFVVLRCDESCPKHEKVDESDLGQAHMWCMTHSIFHCIRNERCREFVLCGVAWKSFTTMQIDRHEDTIKTQEGVAAGDEDKGQGDGDDCEMKRADSGFGEGPHPRLRAASG
ncbi:hypothetical protein VTL71DRAFT_669 [Oculimacula yallundae]|uniref:Uncharacterized protein n=1 Tax=Oculimacula yallundae TaxID=86028 RepID=A0ABR4D1T4_9HELO